MQKCLIYVLLFTVIVFSDMAYAKAPIVGEQVPAWYRMPLGEFEVTALNDSRGTLGVDLLQNVEGVDLDGLLASKFVGNPKMETSVNAYLVNTGGNLVLVDTGKGSSKDDSIGPVARILIASGYELGQVDAVLLTHLHGDHYGGLVDAAGEPVYPNADIYVSKIESEFWQGKVESIKKLADEFKAKGKWHEFDFDDKLIAGITPMKAFGHTPGHTVYAVESEGQKLFIWGDIIHAHAVQFARPDVTIRFDTDQAQAAKTRKEYLKIISDEGIYTAGMHLPFPGIGRIKHESSGSYEWVPLEFDPAGIGSKSEKKDY